MISVSKSDPLIQTIHVKFLCYIFVAAHVNPCDIFFARCCEFIDPWSMKLKLPSYEYHGIHPIDFDAASIQLMAWCWPMVTKIYDALWHPPGFTELMICREISCCCYYAPFIPVDAFLLTEITSGHGWIMNQLFHIPDSNEGWANVGPTSGWQYRRWANVGPTCIAVWDGMQLHIHVLTSTAVQLNRC